MRSGEFLAGLLDPAGPGFVTSEDFDGPHGDTLRTWRRLGFIRCEPGVHPAPSCPHCGEGSPYRAADRLLCGGCWSIVDHRELRAWVVWREAVFAEIAAQLGLSGGIHLVGPDLWELGGGSAEGVTTVVFYHAGGPVSDAARERLCALRRILVLHGTAPTDSGAHGRWVPLAEAFGADGAPAAGSMGNLIRERGRVRFDVGSGVLSVGVQPVGDVPVGSREWVFLACLAEQPDQFVPYRDLKREVMRRTGAGDGADEATFCQKLKSRIKARYVPGIDRLVVTSNKGDGYRLRGEV